MAEAKGTNTAVPTHGDVDRVQMMSLRADGSPDQTPGFEMVGDRDVALEQTREQFRQQAVSAVDQVARGVSGTGGTSVEDAPQDPTIAALQSEHERASDNAVKAADAAVEALFTDDPDRDKTKSSTSAKSEPAAKPGPTSK